MRLENGAGHTANVAAALGIHCGQRGGGGPNPGSRPLR
jgi:hypothetical protein